MNSLSSHPNSPSVQIPTASAAILTGLIVYFIHPITFLNLTKWDNSASRLIYMNRGDYLFDYLLTKLEGNDSNKGRDKKLIVNPSKHTLPYSKFLQATTATSPHWNCQISSLPHLWNGIPWLFIRHTVLICPDRLQHSKHSYMGGNPSESWCFVCFIPRKSSCWKLDQRGRKYRSASWMKVKLSWLIYGSLDGRTLEVGNTISSCVGCLALYS